MTEQALQALLQQYGIMGLIVALAAYAVRHLHKQLIESLEKRVSDAQAAAAKHAQLAEERSRADHAVATAMHATADASHELRVAVERAFERPIASAPRRPGGTQ